jgi:hypothetical protein
MAGVRLDYFLVGAVHDNHHRHRIGVRRGAEQQPPGSRTGGLEVMNFE